MWKQWRNIVRTSQVRGEKSEVNHNTAHCNATKYLVTVYQMVEHSLSGGRGIEREKKREKRSVSV